MYGYELGSEALRNRQVELLQGTGLLQLAAAVEPAGTEQVADVNPDPPFADKYGSLARELYASFHHALPELIGGEADLLNGENAVGGFDVMARILSFGPQTYADYTRSHGRTASLEELVDIMKNSYDTVSYLMGMDGWTNNDYEAALALSGGKSERPRNLYRIVSTEHGLRFVPTDEPLQQAAVAAAKRRAAEQSPRTPQSWEKCPARGLFGLTLWRRLVDLAVADPELLAADLQAALEA